MAEGNAISVLVVDDHAAFRQPFARILEREPDIRQVLEAGSVAEGRSKLEGVDVAVFDFALGDGSGIELIRAFRAVNPHGPVIILTGSADLPDLGRCLDAGASAVLQKSTGIDTIIDAIRTLLQGGWVHTPREIAELVRLAGEQHQRDEEGNAALASLTRREREVLDALADGLSDKEIADRLKVSPDTARNHVANILAKLAVESRLQAVLFALRHGAVTVR